MTTLLSLAAPEVVIMTTPGAASDNKVGIMTTLNFQHLHLISIFTKSTSGATSENKVGIMSTLSF